MGQSLSAVVADTQNHRARPNRRQPPQHVKSSSSKQKGRRPGLRSDGGVTTRSAAQPVDRRGTNFASARLRAQGVSTSEQRPPIPKRRKRRTAPPPFASSVQSRTMETGDLSSSINLMGNPTPTCLSELRTSALSTIRLAIQLLDNQSFPLSRAAKVAGHTDQHPDLSILSYEDLCVLKPNLGFLASILRKIHDIVIRYDVELSKELLTACGAAIMRKTDVDAVRRSRNQSRKGSNSTPLRTRPVPLLAVVRSSLLRAREVVRRVDPGNTTIPKPIWTEEDTKAALAHVSTEHAVPLDTALATVTLCKGRPEQSEFREKHRLSPLCSSVEAHSSTFKSVESSPDQTLQPVYQTTSTPVIKTSLEHLPSPDPVRTSGPSSRPTLEERFAALRKATAQATATTKASQCRKDGLDIQTTTISKSCRQLEDGIAPEIEKSDDETGTTKGNRSSESSSAVIRTVSHSSNAYIEELCKQECSKIGTRTTTTKCDLIEFAILGSEYRPLSQYSWLSKAPLGFVEGGQLDKMLVRMHVAEKLNASPRSLALFYPRKPSLTSRIHVQVILDPYIRLLIGGEVHILDFSSKSFNKSCLTIGELRSSANAKIGERKQHKVHLWYGGKLLKEDTVMLKDTGYLSERVCQGWEPLELQATVEIEEKDCIVCGDELPFSKFPKTITSACIHDINTCSRCLRRWIGAALESNGWNKIGCPECKALLQYADIKANGRAKQFEQYDRLAMRAALNAIPDFRWCLASSCPNGQIHEAAIDGPIFSCSHCGAQHCVTHEVEWHKGETCQQYDYRVSGKKKRDEEKASARTILNTTKPCPKCTAHIEKNDGCDHMTCKHCRYEFCWICFGDYDPIRRHGNRMHKTTCIHYRV